MKRCATTAIDEDIGTTEFQSQARVAMYLRSIGLLFTATIGGHLKQIPSRAKAVSEGYEKGVPDLLVFEPRNGYHGLAIEMKRPRVKGRSNGAVSADQRRWLTEMNSRGYLARVCFGDVAAIDLVALYMMGDLVRINLNTVGELYYRLSPEEALSLGGE